MRSFVILGDVQVCSLTGNPHQNHFRTQLSKTVPPRIYEGAPLAGVSVERALFALNSSHTFRVCRYLTPLEGASPLDSNDNAHTPYPYTKLACYSKTPDPLRDSSVERTLSATSLSGDPQHIRLRLTSEKPLVSSPQAAHSRQILESLRPGGQFEYTELGRALRDATFDMRFKWLQFSAIPADPKTGKKDDKLLQPLQRDVQLSLQRLCHTLKSHSCSKASSNGAEGELIDRLHSTLADFKSTLTLDEELFEKLCSILLKHLTEQQSVALTNEPRATVPDVVVFYDLFENSRGSLAARTIHKPESGRNAPDHHLRSVRIPTGLDESKTYHDRDNSIAHELDVEVLAKAWYKFSIAMLLDEMGKIKADFEERLQLTLDGPALQASARKIGDFFADYIIDTYFTTIPTPHTATGATSSWKDQIKKEDEHSNPATTEQNLFHAVTRLTLSRLHEAEASTQSTTKLPVAEPVIVCCLKTMDLPPLSLNDDDTGPVNYLSSLYRSRWLRKRTILILDADYLRILTENPAGISSESSWEDTVLDTIDAFQRRERLRPYLEFGFLVIRYGVSGALLISKQSSGELSTRLFFDPHKNDRTWTQPEAGEVLGYTSVFAASIVQAMTYSCKSRDNTPVYSDVIDSLHHGIRRALTRCQQICAFAYSLGDSAGVDRKLDAYAFEDLICNHGILPGLYELNHFDHDKILAQWANPVPENETTAYLDTIKKNLQLAQIGVAREISSSPVPTVSSAKWSIVEQSCSSDLEDVAFAIALKGVDRALNQQPKTQDDFVTAASVDAFNIANAAVPNFANRFSEAKTRTANIKRSLNQREMRINLLELHLSSINDSISLMKSNPADEEQLKKFEARKDTIVEELSDLHTSAETLKREIDSSEASEELELDRLKQSVKDELEKLLRSLIIEQRRCESLSDRAKKRVDRVVDAAIKKLEEISREVTSDRSGKVDVRPLSVAVKDAALTTRLFDVGGDNPITLYSSPIARFGKVSDQMTAIDRREVEGISAIQRLIGHYVSVNHHKSPNANSARPLSLAVFGPPGSGKSTAVKKIAESFGDAIDFHDLEFNLSQFTTVAELSEAFLEVQSKKRTIPLVFFDEFDCKFESTDFGWLKYFLAPMEDGKFGKSRRIGPAILVFAGGTSYSFNHFSPKAPAPNDERWINFSRAKGPDFISRLSGHLNVIGIDPTDPDDGLYLLRRAVLIREFLIKKNAISPDGVAKLDDHRVLRAILHAPSYRYGGRSLRMLIDACCSSDGFLRRCNIPATHELDMMVDSKSFLATLRDNWK